MSTLIELLRKYPNVDSTEPQMGGAQVTIPKQEKSKSPSTTSSKSRQKQSPATSETVAAK